MSKILHKNSICIIWGCICPIALSSSHSALHAQQAQNPLPEAYTEQAAPAAGAETAADESGSQSPTLLRITIPDGTTTIRKGEYDGRTDIGAVEMPNSVEIVDQYAFRVCKNLTDLTLSSRLTKIGDSAFRGTGIPRVDIPGSVAEIEPFAFCDCSELKEVILNEGLRVIGFCAFSGTFSNGGEGKIEDIIIPGTVTCIGDSSFANNPLKTITFDQCFGQGARQLIVGTQFIDETKVKTLVFPRCDALFNKNALFVSSQQRHEPEFTLKFVDLSNCTKISIFRNPGGVSTTAARNPKNRVSVIDINVNDNDSCVEFLGTVFGTASNLRRIEEWHYSEPEDDFDPDVYPDIDSYLAEEPRPLIPTLEVRFVPSIHRIYPTCIVKFGERNKWKYDLTEYCWKKIEEEEK
ncbi:MAG: leucine-rich repeat domain-containing protein [Holosporales bacterium]|jgi:hypothetical protein|nr:leucine-rich repeat domain-containing protein [Holosporales bacterium]